MNEALKKVTGQTPGKPPVFQGGQNVPLIGKTPNIHNVKFRDPETDKEMMVADMGKKKAQEMVVKLFMENMGLRQELQRLITQQQEQKKEESRIVKPKIITNLEIPK